MTRIPISTDLKDVVEGHIWDLVFLFSKVSFVEYSGTICTVFCLFKENSCSKAKACAAKEARLSVNHKRFENWVIIWQNISKRKMCTGAY